METEGTRKSQALKELLKVEKKMEQSFNGRPVGPHGERARKLGWGMRQRPAPWSLSHLAELSSAPQELTFQC